MSVICSMYSAHRGGPRSNWACFLVFTNSNVFFKHCHFEEGANLLNLWKGATLIRYRADLRQLSVFENKTPPSNSQI
jgi:hypothetical protein